MALLVLSVVGSDRPGLTKALAAAVLSAGGNWLESHLSRLGGLYVGSVLVELAADREAALRAAVSAVDVHGLDVRGFWIETTEPAQITGAPMDKLGPANVTWILGWADMADRDQRLPAVFASDAWAPVFAQLPGGLDNYLRMESKFTQSLL